MRINPIQQNKVNFESRQRFLNAQQYNDLKTTLTRMNSEVEYAEDKGGMHFASRLIGRMTSNNINAEIIDGRYFVGKVADSKQMAIGQTELRLGNIKLKIDNKTAEIVSCDKPLFSRWSKVMEKVSKALAIFANSHDIKKYSFGISGFTDKGARALDEIIQKVKADTVAQRFIFKKVIR